MTDQLVSKPFYLKPPWNILFDVQKLNRIQPWDVKISFLLTSLLDEMIIRNEIDFRASGVALDSSASIYLMKSKLLLKLEEPPPSVETKPEFLPPPLILPLRYELTTTTIQHLLKALDEALRGENLFPMRQRLEPMLPPPPEILPTLGAYLMEVEKEIKKMQQKILLLAEKNELVTFSKLVSGLQKLERIKTFIILLFMAQRRDVGLWQDEDFGEIYISPLGGQ